MSREAPQSSRVRHRQGAREGRCLGPARSPVPLVDGAGRTRQGERVRASGLGKKLSLPQESQGRRGRELEPGLQKEHSGYRGAGE